MGVSSFIYYGISFSSIMLLHFCKVMQTIHSYINRTEDSFIDQRIYDAPSEYYNERQEMLQLNAVVLCLTA